MAAYIVLTLILLGGMLGAVLARKLTIPAAITGGFTGLLIYHAAGFAGISMMGAFFITGTLATSYKKEFKKKLNADEQHNGRRNAGQVLANSGVAAVCGLLTLILPDQYNFTLSVAAAASLAAAAGDTLSSELGMVFGRRFFNIISLKPDRTGLNGVVSLEGSLIGIAGSAMIALVFVLFYGWSSSFWAITITGFAGNLADSILGATLERKAWLGNNMVNFLNTLCAALAALML